MSFRLSTGLRNAMLAGIGFKGAFDGGKIDIYSGTIPADGDTTEGSGTLICTITPDGSAFPAAGINFDAPVSGSITGAVAETWQGLGINGGGTAAWFRMYDDNGTTGASTTAVRLDGTVGTSSADMIMSSTSIVAGATTTVSTSTFTLPATV